MIACILAGGKGSRMGFEAPPYPKALAPVGDRAIVCHLVRHFHSACFEQVWIAIGHRGDEIVDYFKTFAAERGEFALALPGEAPPAATPAVRLIDTGQETSAGGRIRRLTDMIEAPFLLTWCDGLADIDLRKLIDFHRAHGKTATLTAVHPPGRFGHLTLNNNSVSSFDEKPTQTEDWINGSFFVLNPGWRRWNADAEFEWERECLAPMARDGELMAYRHTGFWQCMDTSKERDLLESLWKSNDAPWKNWD